MTGSKRKIIEKAEDTHPEREREKIKKGLKMQKIKKEGCETVALGTGVRQQN